MLCWKPNHGFVHNQYNNFSFLFNKILFGNPEAIFPFTIHFRICLKKDGKFENFCLIIHSLGLWLIFLPIFNYMMALVDSETLYYFFLVFIGKPLCCMILTMPMQLASRGQKGISKLFQNINLSPIYFQKIFDFCLRHCNCPLEMYIFLTVGKGGIQCLISMHSSRHAGHRLRAPVF